MCVCVKEAQCRSPPSGLGFKWVKGSPATSPDQEQKVGQAQRHRHTLRNGAELGHGGKTAPRDMDGQGPKGN